MRVRLLAAACGLLIALGACSREPQSYDNIDALTAAVAHAGVDCSDTSPGPDAELVSVSAKCDESGITLYLFESASKLADWKKVVARLRPTVTGPNWAATGQMQALDRLAAELRGEVTTPMSASD
jgi:hypothetical protein